MKIPRSSFLLQQVEHIHARSDLHSQLFQFSKSLTWKNESSR